MTQKFFKRLILVSLVSLNISLSIPLSAQVFGKSPRKSAIAPNTNSLPSANLNLPNNLSISPTLNLQDRSGSNLNPDVSITNPKPNVAINSENSEKIDVILENRSSGCRAIANKTINLQPNLCPKPIIRPNNSLIAKANLNALNSDKQMLYPLSVPTAITSGFGWRVHPITGKSTFHQGVDLGAAEGTPVFAAYSGTIEVADWMGGLGKAVVISHGYSSETRYGHLSQILVQQGQWVKQGTVIGLVGSTGMSTGAHLHFELWQRNAGEWAVVDGTNPLLIAMDNLSRYLQSLAGR